MLNNKNLLTLRNLENGRKNTHIQKEPKWQKHSITREKNKISLSNKKTQHQSAEHKSKRNKSRNKNIHFEKASGKEQSIKK